MATGPARPRRSRGSVRGTGAARAGGNPQFASSEEAAAGRSRRSAGGRCRACDESAGGASPGERMASLVYQLRRAEEARPRRAAVGPGKSARPEGRRGGSPPSPLPRIAQSPPVIPVAGQPSWRRPRSRWERRASRPARRTSTEASDLVLLTLRGGRTIVAGKGPVAGRASPFPTDGRPQGEKRGGWGILGVGLRSFALLAAGKPRRGFSGSPNHVRGLPVSAAVPFHRAPLL